MDAEPATTSAAATPPPRAHTHWVQVDKGMLSRVLYPNPVCLLTARDRETEARNVMTITWLTPINNQGGFLCSMNRNRHSATFVNEPGALFVLNVPVQGMESLVLSIGGCSGTTVDKFSAFELQTCLPGELPFTATASGFDTTAVDGDRTKRKKQKLSKHELQRQAIRRAAQGCVAIRDCVAHVLSRVDRVEEDDGHLLLRCTMLAAWCRDGYWNGRNFAPQRSELAPYLTFLGSKAFGVVTVLDADGQPTAGHTT